MQGGTLAEETISTIRTAHAFGTQETLAGLYDVYVGKARAVDIKTAIASGAGFGSFYFGIFASYALGNVLSIIFSYPSDYLVLSFLHSDTMSSSVLLRRNAHQSQ